MPASGSSWYHFRSRGRSALLLCGGDLCLGEFAQAEDKSAAGRRFGFPFEPAQDDFDVGSAAAQVVRKVGAQAGILGVAQERPDRLGVAKLQESDRGPRLPAGQLISFFLLERRRHLLFQFLQHQSHDSIAVIAQ